MRIMRRPAEPELDKNQIVIKELDLISLQFDLIERGIKEHKLSPNSLQLLLSDCKVHVQSLRERLIH